MREYMPVLIVGAIIAAFAVAFVAAYLGIKNKKEALGFDRNIPDGEIVRRLAKYALPYKKQFILVLLIMLASIAHELAGPLEGGGAHALEDEPAAAAVVRLGVDHKGVVDVARAEADGPHHRRAKVKGPQDLAQILFCGGHYFTSQSWSG